MTTRSTRDMDGSDAQGDKKGSGDGEMKEPEWMVKKREYEQRMAQVKNAKLRTLCTICSAKAKLPCPCGTTQYCSAACQKVDWRERGHREACKEIRARAEAPTPSPPRDVFYGPAPRSHADEVRARIAAEHEAARARREANPEPEPASARFGSRCPICLEEWDVNTPGVLRVCCSRNVCQSCERKIGFDACPLCRMPCAKDTAERLARLRRHVENDVPEAISHLGHAYRESWYGLVKSDKKAAKIYKRAVELGNVEAMSNLGKLYETGSGVKLDKKKAKQLLATAADRGYAKAQYNLGLLHYNDEEVNNDKEALRNFKRSADQGFTHAMFMVGICYQHGIGAALDLEDARRWYELAAAKGNKLAIARLEMLERQKP